MPSNNQLCRIMPNLEDDHLKNGEVPGYKRRAKEGISKVNLGRLEKQ